MDAGILVVEDDPSVAEVLRRVLHRLDVPVEWVSTGLAAVTRVEEGGIALVLLDLDLPDIDGEAVCRTVRDSGFAGSILVLSARYGSDVDARALMAGADAFMHKPFSISGLEARARDFLAS